MYALLIGAAWALCSVSQTPRDDGVDVKIEARAEPIGCRDVTLSASTPVTVIGRVRDATGRTRRIRADHIVPIAGGGKIVSVPELGVSERMELEVHVVGTDLTVAIGAVPPGLPRGTVVDEIRTFQLDEGHPAWGFADPRRGSTHIERHVRVNADVGEQLLPLPPGATIIDPGGLRVGVDALYAPAGTDTVVRLRVPGAAPFGREWIAPGSLTLLCPACAEIATSASPGVTIDGTRFDAPAGGEVRWRVGRTVDGEEVVPDQATFQAGLDYRFAGLSLPEPAVPVRLKGMRDKAALLDALYDEVWSLTDARMAQADPLTPRQLNRAWRSGWATGVERGLILQRMLVQEKIRAQVVLTGADPDPVTWTGLEVALVHAQLDGADLWLDPSCAVCDPGQISTRWMGQWALGEAAPIPRAPGLLTRATRVVGDRVEVRFYAEGAAARWLRESVADVDDAHRDARLAALLGMRGATATAVTGLDAGHGPVELTLSGTTVPHDPFDGRETPWAGGIVDTLDATNDGPH